MGGAHTPIMAQNLPKSRVRFFREWPSFVDKWSPIRWGGSKARLPEVIHRALGGARRLYTGRLVVLCLLTICESTWPGPDCIELLLMRRAGCPGGQWLMGNNMVHQRVCQRRSGEIPRQGPHAASGMETSTAWHWGRGAQRPALSVLLMDEVATARGALCSSALRGWPHTQ